MEPFGRYAAHEMHEMNEAGVCSICGQPANRPIPPGQSVQAQALGYAVRVRDYPLAPETEYEPITKNVRSGKP